MDLQRAALAICGAMAVYIWYKRYCALSISDVPGPKNPSWIHGHQWWWQREEAGVIEKKLLKEYGTVARWNGLLGDEHLWIADPKATRHILQAASRLYEKPAFLREGLALFMDRGLVWAAGDAHKRQRKVMKPAFDLDEANALYPCFARCSRSLAEKWRETILNTESAQGANIDVHSGLSKATLDAIGAGAFGYDFGALEGKDNKLTKSYENLISTAFAMPSKGRLFVMEAIKWAPEGFVTWFFEQDQSPGIVSLRENRTYTHEVALALIEEKRQGPGDGKDLLSLLVKANSAEQPSSQLNDEEILAQVRTIMFAGHDATAKALTLGLWALANKRDVQEKLRAEVTQKLGDIRARGDSDFAMSDFNDMPYLLAVEMEILRVYPPFIKITRVPKEDDVLPLSKPVVGVSGKVYEELPIPAGTRVFVSTIGYNSNPELWGPDAYEFRPDRWLDMDEKKPESSFMVYKNLATFSGGPTGCIGWRFALNEMHVFLVTLVSQFDFSLPDSGQKVKNIGSELIMPVVVGEEHEGPKMPLKVVIYHESE